MQLKNSLARLGIRKYTPLEIKQRYNEVLETIKFPTKKGHEVIDTGINLVTPEEWEKVPPGKAIGCALAGTNWVVGLVEKTDLGELIIKILLTKNMSDSPKTHTSKTLTQLMAQTIVEATKETGIDTSEISAVGIALGFSQLNFRVKRGIDAQLTPDSDSKGWHFVGDELLLQPKDRPSLGNLLLINLRETDPKWTAKYFAFRNDTHGVAEDGQTFDGNILPVGFVFGTGVNAVKDSINFELGKFPIKADDILTRTNQMELLPDQDFCQEYVMGGNYIKYRVISTVDLLSEIGLTDHGKEIAKTLTESKDGEIISKIASGNTLDCIGSSDFAPTLQSVCQIALTQAGQLMGTNIAAVAVAAGYKIPNEAVIPIEGSVFWKGFGVKESAQETVNEILPGNKLIFKEAVGLRGVGKVALVQTIY